MHIKILAYAILVVYFHPLGSKRPAQRGVAYLFKSAYFTDISSSNVKTVADRHRHTAYHNKH